MAKRKWNLEEIFGRIDEQESVVRLRGFDSEEPKLRKHETSEDRMGGHEAARGHLSHDKRCPGGA